MRVPFFRPAITDVEIAAVTECLRSGWLTTGPLTRRFEETFAKRVGATHAVALNSCTAALHLALEALGVQQEDLVLVPAFTFAATAEVVRYLGATPVFVDCEPDSLNVAPESVDRALEAIRRGSPWPGISRPYGSVKAIIPMHYGGQMVDVDAIQNLARAHDLHVVEDAAHALPAAYRSGPSDDWRSVGSSSDITCFSFYANKCITTGEGGMAITNDAAWAERMRVMALHGMSKDAWKRFTAHGSWYYEIIAAGYKYNMTDVAAAIGISQIERIDELTAGRARVARRYLEGLADVEEIQLPQELPNRQHSWHLFAIRLDLDRLSIDRAMFIEEMAVRGVGASVHWMPLHMQPYYRREFGYQPDDFPVAASQWPRLISLPIYPTMSEEQISYVIDVVREIVLGHKRAR